MKVLPTSALGVLGACSPQVAGPLRRNSGNFLLFFLLLAKERTTSREAAVPGLATRPYRVYNRTISARLRKGAAVMSRKEGQKRKLLVLLEILARETDEKHPLSVPQLVEKLQEHGVVAERKSVYDDLNTLNNLPDTKYDQCDERVLGCLKND